MISEHEHRKKKDQFLEYYNMSFESSQIVCHYL